MLATFEAGLRRFSAFIEEGCTWGRWSRNQCEITYINQIPIRSGETAFGGFERIFGGVLASPVVSMLSTPEDARLLLRYVIRNEGGNPIGRLIVSAEPARKSDGTNIIQMSLTARGAPTESSIPVVFDFLKIGRLCIVNGFKDITSPEMHAAWGLRQ